MAAIAGFGWMKTAACASAHGTSATFLPILNRRTRFMCWTPGCFGRRTADALLACCPRRMVITMACGLIRTILIIWLTAMTAEQRFHSMVGVRGPRNITSPRRSFITWLPIIAGPITSMARSRIIPPSRLRAMTTMGWLAGRIGIR